MGRESRWASAADLDAVLDELARTATLFAPVLAEGEVVFDRVPGAAAICRDYVNSLVPPRDLFLPTPERLLSYEVREGMPALEPEGHPPAPERVLFGVRSCDVAGFAYLERFFSGEVFGRPDLGDGLFLARRRAVTVLSVVCQEPGGTCMCVCCQGGPALEKGYDWQLTRLAEGWLVEIGSPRGEELAARFASRLVPATPAACAEKQARVRDVVDHFECFSTRRVQTMAGSRMTSGGRLAPHFWEFLGERCAECGGCAFVCPTCYCFNVADVRRDGQTIPERCMRTSLGKRGEPEWPADGRYDRVRLRDCCMLASFVRQAGGGYPRWTTGERCLTRFFHKLSWQFHERMGQLGCTGCGRCVQVCMGGIGIDVVTAEMTAALIHPVVRRRGGDSGGPHG